MVSHDAKAAAAGKAAAKAIADKAAAAAPRVPDPDAAAIAAGKTVRARLGLQSNSSHARHGLPTPPRGPPIAVYSIGEFCVAHGISQAQYFLMKSRGEGPVEMHVGRRRLISVEAAAAWRRAREAAPVREEPRGNPHT